MRRAPALLLLLLAAPIPAAAKCMSAQLSVWPPADATLPTENAIILVEGFGRDQDRVIAIENAGLVSKGARIPLAITAKHRGGYGLVQIALTPTQPLVDGVAYTLELPFEAPKSRWIAGRGRAPRPVWRGAPEVVAHRYAEYGCGPAAHVAIAVPTDGALLFEVTVEDGASLRRWIMPAEEEGRIEIGHGMCSGAFKLEAGRGFSASIVAIGAGGERVAAPGQKPEFHGPGPGDGALP